ncbi:excinuclease ABC subunit UvrB [Candidatus Parcubacteria bacterium]|nr:MAG: excinuclease ABC subunit UvrB [Candidatus Parcubacteria bacterium]
MQFNLKSPFNPEGDQPKAIAELASGFSKHRMQTLLGVTGSGKTFTMANLIQKINLPTLVLSHNKTLAAQLYNEFTSFFPENKVCYFISYYDYYQPESYIPQSDTYIEKDTKINEKIERLRMEAASSLLYRNDVIIVASVSCIYGLGNPADFEAESLHLETFHGNNLTPEELSRRLIAMQYERNDLELKPGRFRRRGGTVDVVQGSGTTVIRLEFSDGLEKIKELHPITGAVLAELSRLQIFPARPFVIPAERQARALNSIRKELKERLPQLDTVASYRLSQRTNYDLEMIEQLGYCKGIENYSRHFDGRKPGEPPYTLLDFFRAKHGSDWLFIIDESHVTLPQVRGMYHGDYSRKKNLIDYGWRLPSAFDNRPLKFPEFEKYLNHVVFTSATPSDYEFQNSGKVAEQIIRPTGLVDPIIEVRPTEGQIDDLIKEIQKVVNQGFRVLVTTLTKRLAEDLTLFLQEAGLRTEYLHSEIATLDRNEIIKNLRLGKFDVLVGINLLREGLDIPEVAMVAILDADKEGFLRNTRSLIQTIGRAARNTESKVIMYADTTTESMRQAIKETDRRRKIQMEFNVRHGITPQTIKKAIAAEEVVIEPGEKGKDLDLDKILIDLELQMRAAAENLDFEQAIELREKLNRLRLQLHKNK